MDYLGEFEQMVMLSILRLRENAYGMKIRTEIKDVAGRDSSFGAIYTTLERLEDKGFLTSWVGEATEPRAGRPKRYFQITASGVATLQSSLRATESLKAGLGPELARLEPGANLKREAIVGRKGNYS